MVKISKILSFLILLGTLIGLLTVSQLIDKVTDRENNSFNKYHPKLDELQKEQLKKEPLTYKKETYYTYFTQDNFERKLHILLKNPKKWTLKRNLNVRLYPKVNKSYKHLEKYNENTGAFDISPKTKFIMRTDGVSNYSILIVSLPFIDIDSLNIQFKNAWNHTFNKPFDFTQSSSKLTSKNVSVIDLYQPIIHQLLKENELSFLPYIKDSLFTTYGIKTYIEKNKVCLGKIENKTKFWDHISNRDAGILKNILFTGLNKEKAALLLKEFFDKKRQFHEVFDIEKLSSFFSIINIFSNNDNKELTLLYNTKKNILEPFYTNDYQIGVLNTYLKNEKIKSDAFTERYVQKLDEFSQISIQNLITKTPKLSDRIKKINEKNPSVLFKSNILEHNKLVIAKGINPAINQKIEFLDIDKEKLSVSIKNFGIFPIEVLSLYYKKKKFISSLQSTNLIYPNTTHTVSFDLPRSFENLFTHKKKRQTGFVFEKDLEKLNVRSRLLGSEIINRSVIIPYQPIEETNNREDIFRKKQDLSDFGFLEIDSIKNIISFKSDFTLDKPLVLPKSYTIQAHAGLTINIEEGGKIISHAPFHFMGTKEKPIKIISKDQKGQGIVVLAKGEKSDLSHVHFKNLSNPIHGNWSTSSAITFYESPVNLDHCIIENNHCEDALNIVRSSFSLSNTSFINTQSDAFDGDFVKGTLTNCTFSTIGNDAIDVSGSEIDISNIKINKAGDKGISVGENSKLLAQNIQINNSAIGIASKDLSLAKISNIVITNTKLGFTAFQKKPEFGPSKIVISNLKMLQVETGHLIENTSTLLIEGKKVKTKQANVKSRMYGVDFGVSSKETKNKNK